MVSRTTRTKLSVWEVPAAAKMDGWVLMTTLSYTPSRLLSTQTLKATSFGVDQLPRREPEQDEIVGCARRCPDW
ncbi:MAG: hypothetical protein IPF66_05725 [Holophagales bacterium]|nr:hypothetical protein [Holophagales bacterium]